MNDSIGWKNESVRETVDEIRQQLAAFDDAMGDQPHRNNRISFMLRERILKLIELLEGPYLMVLSPQKPSDSEVESNAESDSESDSKSEAATIDELIDDVVDEIEELLAVLQARHPDVQLPE